MRLSARICTNLCTKSNNWIAVCRDRHLVQAGCKFTCRAAAASGNGAAAAPAAAAPQLVPLQPEGTEVPQHQQRIVPTGSQLPLLLGLKKLAGESADLLGWRVVTARGNVLLGTVDKVESAPGGPYQLLQVVQSCVLQPYGFQGVACHRLPLVPDIVSTMHLQQKLLVVTPPEGLLDIGRQELLLSFLSEELLPYTSAPAAVGSSSSSPTAQPLMDMRIMPTHQRLLESGRSDLVNLIGKVGGFTQAALLLGFRCSKRPRGYWDSLELLDAELDQFIAGSWVALPDSEPGEEQAESGSVSYYYYNMATRSICWQLPPAAEKVLQHLQQPGADAAAQAFLLEGESDDSEVQEEEEMEEEEEEEEYAGAGAGAGGSRGDAAAWAAPVGSVGRAFSSRQLQAALLSLAEERVMPSVSCVRSAGRFDLHHAIVRNGGYTQVAQQLGRRLSWPVPTALEDHNSLKHALRVLADDEGWPTGVIPSRQQLQYAGRDDIIKAILHLGGWHATAKLLQLKTQRSPQHQSPSSDPDLLVKELSAFIEQQQWQQQQQQQQQQLSGTLAGSIAGSSTSGSSSSRLMARVKLQRQRQQQQLQQQRVADLPTQAALVAAGRSDLAAGLARFGAAAVRKMMGLPPSTRKQLHKNVLQWRDVEQALLAGCSTTKTILAYISASLLASSDPPQLQQQGQGGEGQQRHGKQQQQQQQLVTQEHLSRQLKLWCDEGRLVKQGQSKSTRYKLAGHRDPR